MFFIDDLECGLEKFRPHAPEHVHHMRRSRGFDHGAAHIELVGKQVVVHDIVAGHAQRAQQQRGGEPGAVFACSAVEDQGRGLVDQVLEKACVDRCASECEEAVGLAHQLDGLGFGGHMS